MSRYQTNLDLLTIVAEAIGAYRSEFVFVGGIITGLLITIEGLPNVRPTDDVDMIVGVTTYPEYNKLSAKLRKIGFKHDMDGPLCRFTIHGVKADFMPVDSKVLGFNNRWYPLAVSTAREYILPQSYTIRLINAPLFISTKFEAFHDRGKNDFYSSADIEDVVAIINGRPELVNECWGMPLEVRKYLRSQFLELQRSETFLNALSGLIPYGFQNREQIILFIIDQLARIPLETTFSGEIMIGHNSDPQYIHIVRMTGTEQQLTQREFKKKEEFTNCLIELGIINSPTELNSSELNSSELNSSEFNSIHFLKNIPLEILAKWMLLTPLD